MTRTAKVPGAAAPPAAELTLSVLTASREDVQGLAAQIEGWEALARAAAAVFAAPAWALAAHRHAGRGTAVVVTAHDGSTLVGLLPLALRHRYGRPVLAFMGAGPSDYGTALLDSGLGDRRSLVLDALLDRACEEAGGGLLDLEQLSDADPVLQLVISWAERRQRPVRALVQAGTLQEVFATVDGKPVPPKTRSIRRHRQRTLRLLGAMGRVEVVPDLLTELPSSEEVLRVAAECQSVDEAHPRGERRTQPWRGRSGDLLLSFLMTAPPQSRWLAGVRLDGRLVAYTFDLVSPVSVATYYASYHRDVATCGVGTYLESLSRVRAALWGARQIDFLRGLQAYKRRAATVEHISYRVQVGLAAPRWTPRIRLLALLLAWRQELRKHERLAALGRLLVTSGSAPLQRLTARRTSRQRARSRARRTPA